LKHVFCYENQTISYPIYIQICDTVDHTGAPNAQLIKEQANIAEIYSGKSIAEQNSVDLAWNLLMDTSFTDLRKTICETSEEQARFRQLVVNGRYPITEDYTNVPGVALTIFFYFSQLFLLQILSIKISNN